MKIRNLILNSVLIIIAISISFTTSAQQLIYKGALVDTVKITSNSSYYHFDDKGTTTGVYDVYLIVLKKETNNYILNTYQNIEYKSTFKPDTSIGKETIIQNNIGIDQTLIANLLKQFEITYQQPTYENIGISNKEFQVLTSKKQIIKVAKWFNADWRFKKSYSTTENKKLIFSGCQNIDTFNLYLATMFSNSDYVIVTDVEDHFNVIISTNAADYCFEGKYPNPYKQPWYDHSEKKGFGSTPVLNFSINNALVALLPPDFSRIETLKFEALTNEYIEWYLKRRRIIL